MVKGKSSQQQLIEEASIDHFAGSRWVSVDCERTDASNRLLVTHPLGSNTQTDRINRHPSDQNCENEEAPILFDLRLKVGQKLQATVAHGGWCIPPDLPDSGFSLGSKFENAAES